MMESSRACSLKCGMVLIVFTFSFALVRRPFRAFVGLEQGFARAMQIRSLPVVDLVVAVELHGCRGIAPCEDGDHFVLYFGHHGFLITQQVVAVSLAGQLADSGAHAPYPPGEYLCQGAAAPVGHAYPLRPPEEGARLFHVACRQGSQAFARRGAFRLEAQSESRRGVVEVVKVFFHSVYLSLSSQPREELGL